MRVGSNDLEVAVGDLGAVQIRWGWPDTDRRVGGVAASIAAAWGRWAWRWLVVVGGPGVLEASAHGLHILLRHRLRSIAQVRGRGAGGAQFGRSGLGGVGGQNFKWMPWRSSASQILVKTTKATQRPWLLKPNCFQPPFLH